MEGLLDVALGKLQADRLLDAADAVVVAADVAAPGLHEEALVEAGLDLLDHARDVGGVHGLAEEDVVAAEDELAVEEDEGLEVVDGDLVDLVGRAARGEEALDPVALELGEGDLRGVGDAVAGEREEGAVGVEEGRLDLVTGVPLWHADSILVETRGRRGSHARRGRAPLARDG